VLVDEAKGRTVLVTGAGRNIGRAIALAFAKAGANVAINVRQNIDEGNAVVADAGRLGAEAMVVVGDVGDPETDDRLVASVVRRFGPVDVLVNNAAVRPKQPLLSISVADWNRVLASNLSGPFYLARLVLAPMAERGYGRIINIGGPDGQAGMRDRAHNVAAKAGIIGLTKAIAIEFGSEGITANVVVPGITDTSRDPATHPSWPPSADQLRERLPIPRLGLPGEIADACVFLASDQASYITGQTLHVSGGFYMP
jgi:3-oxoacyl-[acyl-carrier protein] reductase